MPKGRIKLQRDVILPRLVEIREYWICVIAIEGEKTEKQYFDKFKRIVDNTKVKVDILPTFSGHSSPKDIIERLIKYKKANDIQEGDSCWLVFDVDNRALERLNTVCDQAKQERFQVAISNPCFEFWLFLHKFEASELDPSIHQLAHEKRSQAMKHILNYQYHSLPYKEFRDDTEKAIRRAAILAESRKSSIPKFPGTNVYKLVQSLILKDANEQY